MGDLLPFDRVLAVISLASSIGVLLLAPLYVSQRRDIRRLRGWMEREPEHPDADLERSEGLLDQAETKLERVYAERGEPVPGAVETPAATEDKPTPGRTPPAPLPAAARVTSERPALDRITIERAALEPHPRWRRFAAEATRARWLALLAVVALVAAIAAIVVSERLLSGDDEGAPGTAAGRGIEVAVLNATSVGGLAGQISSRIEARGFLPGEVASITGDFPRTVVMFEPGEQRSARRVGRELGDNPAIQPIDRRVQRAAGGADVVIIIGDERATGE